MDRPKHVLDGYKVLDFTQFIAGPTVSRMMAEMGAEIIKVELAKRGDRTRELPLLKNGRSGYFVQQNRGKKSICVSIRKPAGLELIRELIPNVDVLLENFAPGVIGRMGLDYDTVRAINPRIIMCSVSAFGQTGPLSHLPGYDFIAQAYAGITSMIGEADGPPYFPIAALGDVSAGVHAALAITCAMLYRERTGEGQYLDISLLDTYFHCHHTSVELYSLSNGKIKPTRSGAHLPYGAPAGIFKGHSHYIVIVASVQHQWRQLCNAMGMPTLADDARFASSAMRLQHVQDLAAIIQRWLFAMPNDEAALDALATHRVPAAPVLSIEEAVNHPHLLERGTVQTVRDRLLGQFQIPGFPLRFSACPHRLNLEAPMLGEHNEEILSRYLGYLPERIRELEREGILYREAR